MTAHVDYFLLNEKLLNAGAIHSASEVHGFLCGLLSGSHNVTSSEPQKTPLSDRLWLDALHEFSDLASVGESFDRDVQILLFDLKQQTYSQLCSEKFSFTMLLPEDNATLARRIQEIAAWSEGYLHGVVCSGLDASVSLTAESSEGLKDLAHIAQLDDQVEPTEENEKYIMETVEYIKVVVLTVFNELAHMQTGSKPDANPSLH